MAERLVDIDDTVLEEARAALGTMTMEETVARALQEAVAGAARRREVERLVDGSSALLDDEGLRRRTSETSES